jgi:hypothetical protein
MQVTFPTNTKTFGDLTVTNTLRVVCKRKSSAKNTEKMSKNQSSDADSLLTWLLNNYNAMNLSTERFSKDGPNGYMRLDNQKYVPSKEVYVSAIQNNTKQGDDDTNSYSTVEAHSSCFSSGSFGLAMSAAHTDSLANRTIYTITKNATTTATATPTPTTVAAKTWNCSCGASNSLPATYKSGKLLCDGCYTYQDPG